ncbi:hypothetical protein LSTR_LSTR016208 [Laodelphax striatellus]|uniref:Uncharacterized protein n=1 Tax=Laodelphax striatellus TaxID=195883 RepID=A0A482X706_LAOST|nr:hypothetical protein LSTR_LSTR016208 [Laodelphax striatellus]
MLLDACEILNASDKLQRTGQWSRGVPQREENPVRGMAKGVLAVGQQYHPFHPCPKRRYTHPLPTRKTMTSS